MGRPTGSSGERCRLTEAALRWEMVTQGRDGVSAKRHSGAHAAVWSPHLCPQQRQPSETENEGEEGALLPRGWFDISLLSAKSCNFHGRRPRTQPLPLISDGGSASMTDETCYPVEFRSRV